MRRKAQEEIAGFMAVMLVVAIIFLVFLGIFVRRGGTEQTQSTEVSQFLNSMVEFTSSCSLDNGLSFKQIDDLAVECNKGSVCSSGEPACDVLKSSVKEIIESSWHFSSESPEKDYKFTAEFATAPAISLPETTSSACSSTRGATKPFSQILFKLELCLD